MTDESTNHADELHRLFASFDADGSGLVDEQEFRRIVEALGEDPSDEVLSLEFAVIDSDADGLVGFREFADWWLDYKVSQPGAEPDLSD